MHTIGYHIVEEPLIVGNDNNRAVHTAHRIDAVSDDSQCVDIQTRIALVENCQSRLQQFHLQNFVPLFLATRKAFVERSLQHGVIHAE